MDDVRHLKMLASLNRAAFDNLELVDGPVFVVGHKSPDSDTVCSAVGYACLLRMLGFDAQAVVAGAPNRETAYILRSAGLATPPLLSDPSGKNVVLVDHSDYSQALEGMEDAHVIGVIDHHNAGTVRTKGQVLYEARPFGSTATLVWSAYLGLGIEPDVSIATTLLGGLLSDTKGLTSGTTTSADRMAHDELARIAGIADVKDWYQGMYQARISHEGMRDDEIFLQDYKEYEEAGTTFGVGSIEVYDEHEATDLASRMAAHLRAARSAMRPDFLLASIFASREGASFTFVVPDGAVAHDLVERALGEQATFDGTSFVLRPHASRKQFLVPRLRSALAQA